MFLESINFTFWNETHVEGMGATWTTERSHYRRKMILLSCFFSFPKWFYLMTFKNYHFKQFKPLFFATMFFKHYSKRKPIFYELMRWFRERDKQNLRWAEINVFWKILKIQKEQKVILFIEHFILIYHHQNCKTIQKNLFNYLKSLFLKWYFVKNFKIYISQFFILY